MAFPETFFALVWQAMVPARWAEFGWIVGFVVTHAACASTASMPRTSASASAANPSSVSDSSVLRETGQNNTQWVTSPHPDLRRLTVLIRATPPSDLAAKYIGIAHRNERIQAFFEAAAKGGFGSGFIVVRQLQSAAGSNQVPLSSVQRFIVTNRHVVDLADRVTVSFEEGKKSFELPVVYVDPTYDLAVLSLATPAADTAQAAALAPSGFDFETTPAKDQQPVVASGFPGIGSSPSYQVTRGYVSNERFEWTENGHSLIYVQHTAPIDPGSSGGPLTTPDGRLLGINTLKIRRRENVGLAVPVAAVAAAVEHASRIDVTDERAGSTDAARKACDNLLELLQLGESSVDAVKFAIGGPMLARDGFASLDALPERAEMDWQQSFIESPTQVFVHAIALRLFSEVPANATGAQHCVPLASSGDATTVSFEVPTRRGKRTWKFGWEQRRFKLVESSLVSSNRNEKFFLRAGAPKGPRKKWTPTLK